MTVLQTPIGLLQQLSTLLQLAPMAQAAWLPVFNRPVHPVANSDLPAGKLVIRWYLESHLIQASAGNAMASIPPARKPILATVAEDVTTTIPEVLLVAIRAVTQTLRKAITLAEITTDLLDAIGSTAESV